MFKRKRVYSITIVVSLFISMIGSFVLSAMPLYANLEPTLVASSNSIIDQNDPIGSTFNIDVNMSSEPGSFTGNEPTDIVILLDSSISMQGSKIAAAKDAANLFVDKLIETNPQVLISLFSFGFGSYRQTQFTNDQELLHSKINALVAGEATYLEPSFMSALTEFNNYARPNSKRIMILLTDGAPFDVEPSVAAYQNLLTAQPSVEGKIINFTGKVDDPFLNSLVNVDPTRTNYYVANTSNLSKIMDEIANTVVVSLESLKVTATIPSFLEIVPNSLINPNGLSFDMNKLANNQIEATYGKTAANQDLSFSYKVRLKSTPTTNTTYDHTHEYSFKDYQQNKIITKSVSTQVSTPFHKVTTSSTGKGTISETRYVGAGSNYGIAITPDEGYEVTSLLVDGVETTLTDPNLLLLEAVNKDYDIKVTFTKIFTGPYYNIHANNIVLTVDEVKSLVNNDALVTLSKATSLHIDQVTTGNVKLENTDLVAVPGTYTASFYVSEEVDTKTSVSIKVVPKHVHKSGDKVDIVGNNIILTVDEAKKIKDNDTLRTLAKVEAYKQSDLSSDTTKLTTTTFSAKVGNYTATYAATSDTSTTLTTNIQVIPQESIARSDDDAIAASSITMTKGRVDTYTNENLIEWGTAQGFNLKDGSADEVVVSQVNIGKDLNNKDYFVEFALKKDPTIKVRVQVTILSGAIPELKVTNPIQINVNDTFDYTQAVEAMDEEDGVITSKVKVSGTVDTTKKGIYVLTYTVTDSDYNTVSAVRVVVVGDYIVGSDYIYDVENYVILSDEVRATSTEILEKTKVQAWKVVDGTAISSSELEVRDNNGYSSIEKVYTPKMAVKTATQANDVIEAKAIVYDRDKQSDGTTYSVVANQLVLTVDEAKAISNNQALIALTQATAIERATLQAGEVELDTTNFVAKEGTYTATFKVKEQTNTKVTVSIKVVAKHVHKSNDKIDIVGNNIILTVDEAKKITNTDTLRTLAKVEAYKQRDLSSEATRLESTTFSTIVGNYLANYEATNDKSAKLTTNIQVIPQESITRNDDDAIAANSFTITKGQVDHHNDADLIAWASAQGFNLKEGTSNEVVAKDVKLGQDTTSNEYYVTFALKKDEAIQVKVPVKVSAGNAPVLSVTTPIHIQVNDLFNYQDGITVSDVEDTDIDTKVKVLGTVDTTKKGIYVLTYTVTDSDYNTVSAVRVVVVGDYIVGSDYIYDVEDYVILSDDVLATSTEILEKTKVQAWKVVDGTAISSSELEVRDNDGYAKEEKVYIPKIAVKTATQANDVIEAQAIVYDRDKQSDGATYSVVANQLVLTVDEVKALENNQELATLAKAVAVQRKVVTSGNVEMASMSFDVETQANIGNVEVAASDLQANAGMYTVTFKVREEPTTTLTVDVKVVKRDVIKHDQLEIYANDLALTLDQAKQIKDVNDLVDLAKAEVVNRKDMQLSTVKLVETNFTPSAGTYDVIFEDAMNPGVVMTIQVYVVDTHHQQTYEKVEIFANNLIYTETEAKTLNTNEFVDASKAVAFNRVDNTQYQLAVVETNFSDKVGTYDVTYRVEGMDNSLITVQVKVVPQSTIMKSAHYAIVVDPITLSVKEARTLTDEMLIEKGQTQAFMLKDFSQEEVSVKQHDVEGNVGNYTSIFKLVNQPDIEIETSIEVTPRSLQIKAKDITLEYEEAQKLTLSSLLEKADVSIDGDYPEAKDFPQLSNIYLHGDSVNVINNVDKKGDTFEVEFLVDLDGETTTKTIVVTVKEKAELVKPSVIPSGDMTQRVNLMSLAILSCMTVLLIGKRRRKKS